MEKNNKIMIKRKRKSNLSNRIKAIIFDMDGTIIKTEHIWNRATEKILERRGFKTLSDDQKAFLSTLSGIGLGGASEEIKQKFGITDPIEVLVLETKKIALKLFEEKPEFIHGFETFHKKLQKYLIGTSVATNADQTSLNFLNKKMHLHKFFGENIYSIECIGNIAKPNPHIFLHAASKLNVKPAECIVFEDSLFGFQAARAAGMTCIAIKNSINTKNLKLANYAIDSYEEAEEILKNL